MCGAAAWALSASMLSHFSITRKVSSPHFFWIGSAGAASIAAPYSMQPFSARTAGTLARKCLRISSRLPGLAVSTATTWIMVFLLALLSVVDLRSVANAHDGNCGGVVGKITDHAPVAHAIAPGALVTL